MIKMLMKTRERFMLFSVAVWFGVLSLTILGRLWFGPIMIYESNRAVLGVETTMAVLIILFGFRGFLKSVLSMRKAVRVKVNQDTPDV